MTPKKRVLTAIAHREPDRVPIDYKANPGIDARLKQHFGLRPDDAPFYRRVIPQLHARGAKVFADSDGQVESGIIPNLVSNRSRMEEGSGQGSGRGLPE